MPTPRDTPILSYNITRGVLFVRVSMVAVKIQLCVEVANIAVSF